MVQRKEFHQLAHTHLQPELLTDGTGLFPGNAGNLRKAQRFLLHNGQGVRAKPVYNTGSHFRADALDHTAA